MSAPKPGAARRSPEKRIGLFGGSFNPPHLAHLALARLAVDTLQLDELRWVVAGKPWQKDERDLVAPEHRLMMVRLLAAGEPRFVADDSEIRRGGPTFTIDTVRDLAVAQPNAALVLVIGQDQYARFDTWHDWKELLSRVTLAVASRNGETPMPPRALIGLWHRIEVLDLPNLPHSSADIRERVRRGEWVRTLVGDAVASYIDRQALYRAAARR
jgi:nicotinate-nucleotide adenylyltransferase